MLRSSRVSMERGGKYVGWLKPATRAPESVLGVFCKAGMLGLCKEKAKLCCVALVAARIW